MKVKGKVKKGQFGEPWKMVRRGEDVQNRAIACVNALDGQDVLHAKLKIEAFDEIMQLPDSDKNPISFAFRVAGILENCEKAMKGTE